MAIRLRRGPSSQRTTITPEQAEVLYDTDTKNVWIGDNTTPGGTFVGGPGVVNSVLDSANIDLDITANVLTADLTTTGVVANTYGGATLIPQLTVDAYGRITGVTNVSVSIPPSISLETNGTPNSVQNLLDLVAGTNVTLTESLGSVTIDVTAGGLKTGNATQTTPGVYDTTITGVTAYTAGDAYLIKFATANDGASTLNINTLGAINIYKNTDIPLSSGDIKTNQEVLVIYDGTNFQAIGLVSTQLIAYVHNAEGAVINKGQVVYAYQATGNKMSVKLARADDDATSAKTIGMVYDSSIGIGGDGYIIIQGVIEGINTAAYGAGDTLYLSGTTFGGVTNVKPYAPTHLVYVGIVEKSNAGNGQIYVKCQNGYELDEIHDVDLISVAPTNGQVLQYVTGTPNLWKPRSIFGQIFIECNGQGGVVQPGYTGISDITFDGIITGWTIYSVNPTTGALLSGSIDIDLFSDSSTPPTTSLFPVAANRPKLTTQTNNSATGLSIPVVKGDKIRARVISATTCVLVNLQLQVTRT